MSVYTLVAVCAGTCVFSSYLIVAQRVGDEGDLYEHLAAQPLARDFSKDTTVRTRALPEKVRDVTYSQNKSFTTASRKPSRAATRWPSTPESSSSLAVRQPAFVRRGAQRIVQSDAAEVWNKGKYRGRYRNFHQDIGLKMPPWQVNFYRAGAATPLRGAGTLRFD